MTTPHSVEEDGAGGAARFSVRLVALVAASVLAIAALGYWRTGMPDYAERAAAAEREAAAASGGHDAQQVGAMIAKLEAHLKAKPDDGEGWLMLGRANAMLGQAEPALAAYRRALALRGDDARLLADAAELIGLGQGQSLAGEPTQLIDKALAIDPRAPKALALAGAAAFDRKDYAAAVKHWTVLLAVSPPDAPFVAQVQGGIAEAQRLGGLPGGDAKLADAATAAAAAPATAASGSVSGTVTLAAALKARAAPDDTVFIFARAAEGPRVPLAILRRQVKDLPLAFTLDDTQAMSPQTRLSAFPKVVVIARVSKSGQAAQQPGDLLGQSDAVAVGAQGLRVEIGGVAP